MTSPDPQRLAQQLRFITELDRLKQVLRQTRLMDASRRENSAEHSWHLAVMATILLEYAPAGTDLTRVLEMVVFHDVVEIEAGDTFAFDVQANHDKSAREQAAATSIFGLLPDDLEVRLRGLWDEFESAATNEARFANALDRLQPLLHNYHTQGGTWRAHQVSRDRVRERMRPIEYGAPTLWPYVLRLIDDAQQQGFLVS